MKPRPDKHYRPPRYPTRLRVAARPALLENNLPPAWRASREIAGAAALFLAANLAGCSSSPDTPRARTAVAPVFVHGEGQGAFGCVVVSPPTFMSEDEALLMIEEELGKQGLNLSRRDVTAAGVMIPAREEYWYKNFFGRMKIEYRELPNISKPLTIDRQDPDKQVSVVFVSYGDYFERGGASSNSTVQGYDLPEVARFVADKIKDTGPGGYFGVLYDPVADPGEAKELLRLQVKDFVDWLKAQGAI